MLPAALETLTEYVPERSVGTVTKRVVPLVEATVTLTPWGPEILTTLVEVVSKLVPVIVRMPVGAMEVGETVVIERTLGALTVKFTPVEVRPVVTFLTVSE